MPYTTFDNNSSYVLYPALDLEPLLPYYDLRSVYMMDGDSEYIANSLVDKMPEIIIVSHSDYSFILDSSLKSKHRPIYNFICNHYELYRSGDITPRGKFFRNYKWVAFVPKVNS